MFKKIDHVEIVVSDMDKAVSFYTSILGFKVKQRTQLQSGPLKEITYIELGGSVVELMRTENTSELPKASCTGCRAIAIEVEDMDKAIEYLRSKGVPVTWGPMTIGKAKRAEINDPDGIPIELRQW